MHIHLVIMVTQIVRRLAFEFEVFGANLEHIQPTLYN